MANLLDIHDFIQVVAEAVANALEIDTSVVDTNLVRIAGTAAKQVPHVISTGVIKTVMETGRHHMTHDTRSNPHCITCRMRERCNETAFLHCPIFHRGKIIGVMGLMCMDDEQRQRMVSKPEAMLNFVRHMCDMISLKLDEYENHQKEQELYQRIESHSIVLDQILNSISDGYIIVDNQNQITRANQSAMRLLGLQADCLESELLGQLLRDFDRDKVKNHADKQFSSYDEVIIGNQNYGVTISLLSSERVPIGKIMNFKTLDKIGSRAIRKATSMIMADDILGDSPGMRHMKEMVNKSAGNNLSVLLCGESGTGKELVARCIHNSSDRRNRPFIAVNCAAIPEPLLESELFGYEQGSFTGANKGGRAGKFEQAHQGTLFLDEIGDMPLVLQAKLLRVLQDFAIERVGSTKPRHVDVRIIAATNQNLDALLESGQFRRDLYYRINIIPIYLPALRGRGNDIELLANAFLQKYSSMAKVRPKQFTPEALQVLRAHSWPGNVRELENLVQYLCFITTGDVIGLDVLPAKFITDAEVDPVLKKNTAPASIVRPLAELEQEAILAALSCYGQTTEGKRKAAQALGIGKTTLYRKLAELSSSGAD